MDERRGELGQTWDQVAEESGLSTETLYRAASGRRMRTTTRKGIERALHWEAGSVAAILNGNTPTAIDPPRESALDDTEAQIREALLVLRRALPRDEFFRVVAEYGAAAYAERASSSESS